MWSKAGSFRQEAFVCHEMAYILKLNLIVHPIVRLVVKLVVKEALARELIQQKCRALDHRWAFDRAFLRVPVAHDARAQRKVALLGFFERS